MGWVPCHEAANEVEAERVVALLERDGIPSRVQPTGRSAFPTIPTTAFGTAFGVQVLVLEDDLPRARTIIEAEGSAESEPATIVWHCPHCHAVVEDDRAACWSCGRSRSEASESAVREADVPARMEEPRLPIMDTVAAALRLAIANPLVLVAAVPTLAWAAIATALELPGQGFFASQTCARGFSQLLLAYPHDIFFGPLGEGLAIAIAVGSVRGASWSDSLALVGRRLPALVMLAALPLALFGLATLLGGSLRSLRSLAMVLAVIPSVYVAVRLTFGGVAVVVDEIGVVEGLKRSWRLTHTLWWTTLGLLIAIGVVAFFPIRFVPAPFDIILACAAGVVFQVTLLLAYLRLVGTQPVDQSTVRHPPPIPAPAV